jgi:hypothetical protein
MLNSDNDQTTNPNSPPYHNPNPNPRTSQDGFVSPGGTHYSIPDGLPSSSSVSSSSSSTSSFILPPRPPEVDGFVAPDGVYYPPARAAVRERLNGGSRAHTSRVGKSSC